MCRPRALRPKSHRHPAARLWRSCAVCLLRCMRPPRSRPRLRTGARSATARPPLMLPPPPMLPPPQLLLPLMSCRRQRRRLMRRRRRHRPRLYRPRQQRLPRRGSLHGQEQRTQSFRTTSSRWQSCARTLRRAGPDSQGQRRTLPFRTTSSRPQRRARASRRKPPFQTTSNRLQRRQRDLQSGGPPVQCQRGRKLPFRMTSRISRTSPW
mmetsp:Transcript_14689/g.40333  ORF Transcript_14689/g.40333 Transcript_14689/m.40333 type:complete len:209 (-) Transcript_14689:466-1092(-)